MDKGRALLPASVPKGKASRLRALPRHREPCPLGAPAYSKTPTRHLLPSEPSPMPQGTHWCALAVRCSLGKKRERERERVMIWGWSWGGGSLGAGWCTTAEEAERGAMVTVDVEAVLVQAVGSQPRDASGLVADFMVEAHPVQGQGGGLLPVGADCVHRRVVPFPHWPGKHSTVPEHPSRLCALSLQGQALGLPQPSLRRNASSACPTRACVVAGHCSPASPDALGRFKEHGARQSI